jgi:hypothetical protein
MPVRRGNRDVQTASQLVLRFFLTAAAVSRRSARTARSCYKKQHEGQIAVTKPTIGSMRPARRICVSSKCYSNQA